MAEAGGLEAAYVVGDARTRAEEKEESVDGRSHAWNAVKLDGRWYLLDVTWDAGTVKDGSDHFERRFGTDYFLTPPEVMGVDHFPEDSAWQLREAPLSRGEFMRQPMLKAGFFAAGLKLRSPDRSQVTVEHELRVEIENPRGRNLLVAWDRAGESSGSQHCQIEGEGLAVATCRFPSPGAYQVSLCHSSQKYGSYPCEGTLLVNRSE